MHREREDDGVGELDHLVGRHRVGAGGEHLDLEGDPVDAAGPGERHVVAGGECRPRERQPKLAGADDAEPLGLGLSVDPVTVSVSVAFG